MDEEKNEWLEEIFPEAKQQREELFARGVDFAQRYLVFAGPTADRRAAELLEHWTRSVRRTRLKPGASPQEYAAHNALREFVEAIHAQIELAQSSVSVATRN